MKPLIVNRRMFLIAGSLMGMATPAFPQRAYGPPDSAQSPEEIVRWIYAEAVKPDGSSGGQKGGTIFGRTGPIRRMFSGAFLREWDLMQVRIKKSGDSGLDFDPVSNSQDPQIARVSIVVERTGPSKSTVAATFGSSQSPKAAPRTVRYDFVLEAQRWKIDDIRGRVERDPWSLRALLKSW